VKARNQAEAPHPPGNVGNPNISVIALKPLIKILPVTRLRRNPNGTVSRALNAAMVNRT
jgi:hypothetical protein